MGLKGAWTQESMSTSALKSNPCHKVSSVSNPMISKIFSQLDSQGI